MAVAVGVAVAVAVAVEGGARHEPAFKRTAKGWLTLKAGLVCGRRGGGGEGGRQAQG